MRPRSKSVSASKAVYQESQDSSDSSSSKNLSDGDEYNARPAKAKKPADKEDSAKSTWPPGDQLLLLSAIRSTVPKKDDLPFDKRLGKIPWKSVAFKDYSIKEVKAEFDRISKPIRKHRLLTEILDDTQKIILPEIGLQRPVPSFMLFLRDNKDEIDKLAASRGKRGSYTHIAAELFNKCSDKVKNEYKEKTKKMKEEYYKTISTFNLKVPKRKSNKIKVEKRRKTRDTPAQLYAQTKLLENSNTSDTALRQEYMALPNSKKLKWILRWIGVNEGQKANLEQYLKCEKMLSKPEMDIWNDYEGRPRAATGYTLFRRENPSGKTANISLRDSSKALSEGWRNLPAEEKNIYNSRANKIRKNYMSDAIRFVTSLPEDRRDYEIKLLSSRRKTKYKDDSELFDGAEDNNTSKVNHTLDETRADNTLDETQHTLYETYANNSECDDDEEQETVFQCDTGILLQSPIERQDDEKNDKPSTSRPANTVKQSQGKLTSFFSPQAKRGASSESDENQQKAHKLAEKQTKQNISSSPKHHKNGKKNPNLRSDENEGEKGISSDQQLSILRPPLSPRKRKSGKSDETPVKVKRGRHELTENSKSTSRHSKSPEKTPLNVESADAKSKKKRKLSEDSESDFALNLQASPKREPFSEESDFSYSSPSKQGNHNASQSDQREKKFRKILAIKPAESLVQHYANVNFGGSLKKAKKAFKSLKKAAKEELSDQYEHAKRRFERKFESFAKTLSAMELSQLSSEVDKHL